METNVNEGWAEWFAKKIEDDVVKPNGMLIPGDLKIKVQKKGGKP